MSKDIIQQIAELLVVPDDNFMDNSQHHTRAGISIFAEALEPFIPKWVKVAEQKPKPDRRYIVRFEKGFTGYLQYRHGYFRVDAWTDPEEQPVEWMEIPTTHPFEELLKSLKNGK